MESLGTRTTARSTPPAPALHTRINFVDKLAVYFARMDPPSATTPNMTELTIFVVAPFVIAGKRLARVSRSRLLPVLGQLAAGKPLDDTSIRAVLSTGLSTICHLTSGP